MRTDVKIGLIAVFVILAGLVAYFAWQPKKTETPPLPSVGAPLTTGTDAGVADGSVRIAPPALSTSMPTEPATMASGWPTTSPATSPAWGTSIGRDARVTGPATTLPRTPWDRDGMTTTSPAWENTPITPPTPVVSSRPAWDTTPVTTDTTTNGTIHLVAAGDTFGKLAKQYHTTIKSIAAANPGVDSSHLKLKQKLNIPGGTTATETTTGVTATTTTPPATRPHVTAGGAAPGGKYTVQKGDTLTKIAVKVYGNKKYAARIARVNRAQLHGDPNSIEVGQVLNLPAK